MLDSCETLIWIWWQCKFVEGATVSTACGSRMVVLALYTVAMVGTHCGV
jgi:hypothetical protein